MGDRGALVSVLLVTTLLPSAVLAASQCPSYCNEEGHYKDTFPCGVRPDLYCCGDLNTRYCCSNSSADISGEYENVYVCSNSSWWIYHWQVIIGMLASVIVVLLLAACCCHCCSLCKRSTPPTASNRASSGPRAHTSTDSTRDNSSGPNSRVDNNFDPESPFAFQPPPYESLEKDPPKYEELFMMSAMGSDNPGFVSDMTEAGPSSSVNPASTPAPVSFESDTSGSTGRNSTRSITSHGSTTSDALPSYEIAISRDQLSPEVAHPLAVAESDLTRINIIHVPEPASPATNAPRSS